MGMLGRVINFQVGDATSGELATVSSQVVHKTTELSLTGWVSEASVTLHS